MLCCRSGCRNEATKFPVLSFSPRGRPDVRVQVPSPYSVCSEHAVKDVSLFMEERLWNVVVTKIMEMGLSEPDRRSGAVAFMSERRR